MDEARKPAPLRALIPAHREARPIGQAKPKHLLVRARLKEALEAPLVGGQGSS